MGRLPCIQTFSGFKKKGIYHPIDFAMSVDHRMKIKENGKGEKYLDLTIEQWNIKVMVILIVVGELGLVPGGIKDQRRDLDHTDHTT